MNRIIITDTTMKQAAKATGAAPTFREKLELAKLLDRTGVDKIELPATQNTGADCLLIKSIAAAVKHSAVSVVIEPNPDAPGRFRPTLQAVPNAILQVCAPVSAVQMEYLAGKKPQVMSEAVVKTIEAACTFCRQVEFCAEDATRADPAFLRQIITAALTAGAQTITLCDTAGIMLPEELAAFLEALQKDIPALADCTLAISCANTLAMADACAVAALRHGVRELKAAAFGSDCISLSHCAAVLAAKSEQLGITSPLENTTLHRTLEQIAWLCRTGQTKAVPSREYSADTAVHLTARDDAATVSAAAAALGYELSSEDLERVYGAFRRIAGKKEFVEQQELDAIIAATAVQVPPTYRLENFMTTSGNTISATAHICMKKDETMREGLATGDGPIDAAFRAIEQILGHHFELDDFQIQAVTQGHEAMGQAVVKLRSNGRLYSGRGISTDIVGASIHAYVEAVNKILYEEEGGTAS